MKILSEEKIKQKIQRIAIEILEHNWGEDIVLAGINNNGLGFAKMLYKPLVKMAADRISLCQIKLSPANPLAKDVQLSIPLEELKNKVIIIVDDVANTGRTIFYACKPLMQILPKKIEVAVLIDRTHKSFPIKVDYMGLSLATTMKEDIEVRIRDVEEMEVNLV